MCSVNFSKDDIIKCLKVEYEREIEKERAAIDLLEDLKIMIKEYKHADLISEIDDIIEMLEEVNYGD